ncbi:M91 family zinc metallopeptidase [Pseudomonas sp. WS 5021]|uniref:M91 family zinc metallopeptidase n=1 Tax=Pseudomonas sp. WS 5021 TaxID=2717490 RepID=UPI0021CC7F3D|nr:M91 family zinc metallopeptidase [Pseudomonas sp. WS 5021]
MNTIAPHHAMPALPPHTPQAEPAAVPGKGQHQPFPSARTPSQAQPELPNFSSQDKQLTLVDDGNLRVRQSLSEVPLAPGKSIIVSDALTFETGNSADTIHLSNHPDGRLKVEVNGKPYLFNVRDSKDSAPTSLHIKSHGGDDKIKIDPGVMLPVKVEAGDGDDDVQAGSGPTQLFGGKGNDTLRLGSGNGYVEGNEGDDTIVGGTGSNVMYGNNGNDRLYAGAGAAQKQSYLDGGSGNDQLYAGNGHTVINGGQGDDVLVGHDRTTFYSGKGHDTIWSNRPDNRIYAKPTDRLLGGSDATITPVSPSNAGKEGFQAQGTQAFKQRVEDDLELLRGSPVGQQMLAGMDAVARQNGAPLPIIEGSSSHFDDHLSPEQTKQSHIKEGAAGRRINSGTLQYNPFDIYADPNVPAAPIVTLQHESAHAWNAGTGTFFSGHTQEQVGANPPVDTPNVERQAVGLPTTAAPFDFDNDPLTPPTSTNPKPFTENGLREEMGYGPREHYAD